MTTFARRRWLAMTLTLLTIGVIGSLMATQELSFRRTAFLSGWMLLVTLLVLVLYNLRKKLTYPPLLKSASWLQIHAYVGLLSIALFLMHIGFRIPDGRLESVLALLFVGVAGSGVVGLFLSRAIPPRLAVRGQEVLFERIPMKN